MATTIKYFNNQDSLLTYVLKDPRLKEWTQTTIEKLWYFAHDMLEGVHSIRETKVINGFKFEIIKLESGILELNYYLVD